LAILRRTWKRSLKVTNSLNSYLHCYSVRTTEANMGLSCGTPLALANLKDGEVVVDLGSGGGLDCFLAAKKVGDSGRVIGVDMTPSMIELATANAKKFGKGTSSFIQTLFLST